MTRKTTHKTTPEYVIITPEMIKNKKFTNSELHKHLGNMFLIGECDCVVCKK